MISIKCALQLNIPVIIKIKYSYLRIPKIYSLKFINLTITGKSLPNILPSLPSLTLVGRLFHSAGAAIWNDLSPRVFFVFPMHGQLQ